MLFGNRRLVNSKAASLFLALAMGSVKADQLAHWMAWCTWTFQQNEDFEASRECARNIVCKAGLDDHTDCLVNYWVGITKFKVLQDGRDASLVDDLGMGTKPNPAFGINQLKFQNCYQKQFMKSEVGAFKRTCSLLSATVDALLLPKEADRQSVLSFLGDVQDTLDIVLTVLD